MARIKKTTISEKTDRVNAEKARLLEIFKDLESNKLKTCQTLIERAAFITVSLEDLEKDINKKGWVEKYQNGENQSGYKKATAADLHISLTKNLNAIMKQLLELVPPAQKESRLTALMNK